MIDDSEIMDHALVRSVDELQSLLGGLGCGSLWPARGWFGTPGISKWIFLALNRTFEMRPRLDRDGLVYDIALDLGGRGEPDLETPNPANNPAVDHDVVGDYLAADGRGLSYRHEMRPDISLDRSFYLDIAGRRYVALDRQISRKQGWRGLWFLGKPRRWCGRRRWISRRT